MTKLAPRPQASSRPHRPAYRWWVVVMLWFVCFFNYADRQALSSVLPLLAREFHLDDVAIGWIGSAFAWVYAAAAPLAGLTADRRSRKLLILGACVGWSFFTLATAWTHGFSALFVVRALTGLGETFYFPAAMSMLSDYHGPATRSRAMSWHQSAVYAGTILGSWLAAALAERHGWRAPFWMFGPIGIAMALSLAWMLREPRRGGEDAAAPAERGPEDGASLPLGQTVGIIVRTPVALLLMAAFLCANFVAVIFLTWTPMFLVDKFALSLSAAGLTSTLYIQLASALTVPFAGWLADALSTRFAGGRMMVQAAGLVIGALFVFIVGSTNVRGTLLLAMTVFGIGKGLYDSGIFAALYDAIEPRARGTAAGLMNTVGWGGGALGPIAVGLATRYGRHARLIDNMSEAIACSSIVYVVGALLIVAAIVLASRRPASER